MTQHRPDTSPAISALGRAVAVVFFALALAWFLVSDYHPMSLAVLTALYFCAYVALRLMLFMDNNGFTPERRQVGLTWALTGFNAETQEFDVRPVRVYFLLLALMSAGLLLRPLVQWVIA